MGGNALDGVGKIHKSEVGKTLYHLAKKINWPIMSLTRNLLGSTGKKEYSGDIDIGVAYEDEEQIKDIHTHFNFVFGENDVKRYGKNIHVKFPIVDYDPDHDFGPPPRTGYVQVDFIFGNVELQKLYSYAPSETESDFTGTHRNLGIISICRWLDRIEGDEKDDFGRPIYVERWKWSPKVGLQKIIRECKRNKTDPNRWLVTRKDTPISMPFTKKDDVINILFRGVGNDTQLDTLENIVLGVRKSYDEEQQENIFRSMAFEMTKNVNLKKHKWSYPPEIEKYCNTE